MFSYNLFVSGLKFLLHTVALCYVDVRVRGHSPDKDFVKKYLATAHTYLERRLHIASGIAMRRDITINFGDVHLRSAIAYALHNQVNQDLYDLSQVSYLVNLMYPYNAILRFTSSTLEGKFDPSEGVPYVLLYTDKSAAIWRPMPNFDRVMTKYINSISEILIPEYNDLKVRLQILLTDPDNRLVQLGSQIVEPEELWSGMTLYLSLAQLDEENSEAKGIQGYSRTAAEVHFEHFKEEHASNPHHPEVSNISYVKITD